MLVVFFAVAILAGPSASSSTISSVANPWTGKWSRPASEFGGSKDGVLTLTQNGASVTGSYDWHGGGSTVKGTVSGSVFTNTWSEPGDGGRWTGASGTGELTLSADQKSFSGFTDGKTGQAAGLHGNWTGTYIGQRPTSTPTLTGKLLLSWKMPDRFGLDENGDGLIDYSTTYGEVNPISWLVDVRVRACDANGIYVFSTGGRSLRSEEDAKAGACWFRVYFPKLGRYTLAVTGTSPGGKKAQGSTRVAVSDWLVVGIGDSAGSGEGSPDKPGAISAKWEFERCHRSAKSFEPQTALRLEDASLHSSVTFVHVACSGAGIKEGAVGEYFGIAPGGANEPLISQVKEAKALTGGRKVDAVIASIGVNDIGFGAVIKFCAAFPDCMNHAYQGKQTLGNVIKTRLDQLRRNLYPQLAAKLATLVKSDRVYITEYFDPLRDDTGRLCDSILGGIDRKEIEGLEGVLGQLNLAVEGAATANGWHYVGLDGRFSEHGYCASDNWIVTLAESLATQARSPEGTLHPNPKGYEEIASLVFPDVYRNIKGMAPGS